MEALLVWWNITWEGGTPVYTQPLTERACYRFIGQLANELPGREVLGGYNDRTGICRLIIFKDRREYETAETDHRPKSAHVR
jgi:hypothetical protein